MGVIGAEGKGVCGCVPWLEGEGSLVLALALGPVTARGNSQGCSPGVRAKVSMIL